MKITRTLLGLLVSVSILITFANCNQIERKPTQRNIPIKVAIIYSVGGAQAVARENFYLLKKDALQIWKDAGIIKDEKKFGFEYQLARLNTKEGNSSRFDEAIKPHIVNTTTTDFEGNAVFENVPEGEYYIYGVTGTRGGIAIWSYKVSTQEIKTILLDNKNAIYAV